MEEISNSFKITLRIAELTCRPELSDSKIYGLNTTLHLCFQEVREGEKKKRIFLVGAGFIKAFKLKVG